MNINQQKTKDNKNNIYVGIREAFNTDVIKYDAEKKIEEIFELLTLFYKHTSSDMGQ